MRWEGFDLTGRPMPNGLALNPRDKELLAILSGYGVNTSLIKGVMRGFGDGTYKISYDLMLCTYCGNFESYKLGWTARRLRQ
jgi:hypothetical protein